MKMRREGHEEKLWKIMNGMKCDDADVAVGL